MQFSRRAVVLGSAACFCAATTTALNATAPSKGCIRRLRRSGAAIDGVGRVATTSGVSQLDNAVHREMKRLNEMFDGVIDAKVEFTDDANAYYDDTANSLIFGRRLLVNLQRSQINDATLIIVAHEVCHYFQARDSYWDFFKFYSDASVVRSELMADWFAGSCVRNFRPTPLREDANMFQDPPDSLSATMCLMHSLGDLHSSNVDHHGRPTQRFNAVRDGWSFGGNWKSFEGQKLATYLLDRARSNTFASNPTDDADEGPNAHENATLFCGG